MGKINEKLSLIQSEIKVNKGLYNSFGKYHYRNFESICEAAKPLMQKYKCSLAVSDDIVLVGDRVYVKATATLSDTETGESVSATAFAREPEDKKGMSSEQITGSASSYARKYAAGGLFLLDDNKDADTNEYKQQQDAAAELENLENLKAELDRYIKAGLLKGDGLRKAQSYRDSNDIEGLKRTVQWCKSKRPA